MTSKGIIYLGIMAVSALLIVFGIAWMETADSARGLMILIGFFCFLPTILLIVFITNASYKDASNREKFGGYERSKIGV